MSDVVLAVDYCVTDNPWWCGLTWAFITVPALTGPFFLCFCFYDFDFDDDDDDDDHNVTKTEFWKIWKSIEICFESGPQLLLQLYIMAITDLDPTAVSGKDIRIIVTQSSFSINISFCQICQNCIREKKIEQKTYLRQDLNPRP